MIRRPRAANPNPARISRRELLARLGYGGAGAALGFALARCGGEPDTSIPWSVAGAELATIGTDRLAWSWVTEEPQPTRVRLARGAEGAFSLVSASEEERIFHYAEIDGLDPGTLYRYELTTAGDSHSDQYSPGEAQTLAAPSSERVARFATMNDIHMGTDEVGLIDGRGTPYAWPDPANPHYRFAAESAVREINERGVDFVIVKGDLTSEFTSSQFEMARDVLDGLEAPYIPIRGNHDRQGSHADDYYLAVFGDLLPERASSFVFEHGALRFVCLDTSDPATGISHVPPESLSWLDSALRENAAHPTFLVQHHPVDVSAVGWMGLTAEQRVDLLAVLSPHDHLVGVLSGHSHRDLVTRQNELGPIPCVETAATLHYPSGYAIYDVHDDGYTQVCYRMACPECLEWNEMTKELYAGLGRSLLFSPADLRCFTYEY